MPRCHRIVTSVGWALVLVGCAASTPRTETPKTRNVVIDEPTVVTAAPRSHHLPPLPESLQPVSASLQCGYDLVESMLDGQSHAPLPAACASRVDDYFSLPPQYRMVGAAKLLVEVLERDDDERDVGRALLAVMIELPLERASALVHSKAACAQDADPAACEHESQLMQLQLAGSIHAALYALDSCADSATKDPSFEAWRAMCTTHLTSVKKRVDDTPELAVTLEAFREKARIAAGGPRPVGPAACWMPSLPGAGSSTQQSTCAEPPAGMLAAPWAPAPSLSEEYAGPWPRDHLFGPLDPKNLVRVSMALAQAPRKPGVVGEQVDARTFASSEMHRLLGQCLADDVASDTSTSSTLAALRAEIALDARGKVRSAKVTKLEDAAAPPPSKKLLLCVQQTLLQGQPPCTVPPKAVKLEATICLGREADGTAAAAAQ